MIIQQLSANALRKSDYGGNFRTRALCFRQRLGVRGRTPACTSSINPPALVCLLRPLWVAPHHLCWKPPPPPGFASQRSLEMTTGVFVGLRSTSAHMDIDSMTLKGRRRGTCARDKRCAFALIRREISGPLLHFLPVLVAADNFRLR